VLPRQGFSPDGRIGVGTSCGSQKFRGTEFMEGEQGHSARMFAALMIGVERAILLFTRAGVPQFHGR
jgi:hypothetical protein